MNNKIPYASAFVAFILPKLDNIKDIILFGSVARDEDDENSDIDLFININEKKDEQKIEDKLKKEIPKFYKSKIAEPFVLRGIKNEIKIHVGILDEWKLKRSIISDGITLYGKYKELPKKQKHLMLFTFDPIKNITKRNKITRLLFGRKEKGYLKSGLLEQFEGKKLSPTCFIVPIEHSKGVIKIFSREKVSYRLFEFWGGG